MAEPDYLQLDGKALQLFLLVLEEGSISRTAVRLGTSQSNVSHTLEKLRQITGDPLFVRAGRGIAPTSTALELAETARCSLDSLRQFGSRSHFDPASARQHFILAANDYQRDYLLPGLFKRVRCQAPGLSFSVIPSQVPDAESLRQDHCQLMLTPHPPEASDIIQRRLLSDHFACYFDPGVRTAPDTPQAYQQAQHVAISLSGTKRMQIDADISALGLERDIFLTLPNFAGIWDFIRGTDLIATLPSLLGSGDLEGIAQQPLPFETPPLDIYLVWHKRYHDSPAHRWLREQLIASLPARSDS
ncbi:LysR family transcriptional regulator [Motiliproteus sp.]|uniref:LysR family transcriptional regulator n=1 Tax=Motiliproteus sp. TaxID=1898955 RepID=UPI003BABCC69